MQPPKPFQEKKPWGDFIEYTCNVPSTIKIITVNPGEAFSLQTHHNRDEFWHILSGTGTVIIGDTSRPIVTGDYFVPRETAHRIQAGDTPVVFLEISFGTFDEKDITRLEDRYGRTASS
ncbi:MAG: phosphomannose isomerase type II C-terminal cupin domain [Patescibacteria group bacterium]